MTEVVDTGQIGGTYYVRVTVPDDALNICDGCCFYVPNDNGSDDCHKPYGDEFSCCVVTRGNRMVDIQFRKLGKRRRGL